MTSPSPQLDYAPAPRRARRWRRRMLLAGVVVLLASCGWKWGPAGWRQAQLLYWQRQCLRYAPPPDQVVYESDPARVAALRGDPKYSLHGDPMLPRWSSAWRNPPDTWVKFCGLLSVNPMRNMDPWHGATHVFLHERHSQSGASRLVVVEFADLWSSFGAQVIAPGGWFSEPQGAWFNTGGIIFGYPGRPPYDGRIYAGQADPNDESRFTIRYEARGEAGVLDGVLRDDGQVVLTVRDGPWKVP